MEQNRKNHWEHIYQTKQPHEVSWTQEIPATSLKFIDRAKLSKDAEIIDIGGGDSKFVDFLVERGFKKITVLDISKQALKRAKKRLGEKAKNVNWIEADINDFAPENNYDFWHDRAAFHFLTTEKEIEVYVKKASKALNNKGLMTIGTFSNNGPKKCSGLEISRYTEESLSETLAISFKKINCVLEDHVTPFQTTQNFLFCSFKKK